MRYQVKWTDSKGNTRYGIIMERSGFNKDAYKNIPSGMSLVEDAVLPVTDAVPDTSLKDIPFGTYGENECDKYIQAEYEKAQAISDAIPDNLIAVGSMFEIGVADGCATYVVTKLNKKTCNVEWRGYNPDRYYDHYFGAGRKGVLTRDVYPYIRRLSKRLPKMALVK